MALSGLKKSNFSLFMKLNMTITNGKGGTLCYKHPAESRADGVSPPVPAAQNSLWADIGFHACSDCPLKDSGCAQCPAAVAIQRVVASPVARQSSFERVNVRVERGGVSWESELSVEEALGALVLYALINSGCPELEHNCQFYDFFSPSFSYEKWVLQYLSIHLIINHMKKDGDSFCNLKELNPQKVIMVIEQMLERIRAETVSPSDAIPNALCHLHAIFQMLLQPEIALREQVLASL